MVFKNIFIVICSILLLSFNNAFAMELEQILKDPSEQSNQGIEIPNKSFLIPGAGANLEKEVKRFFRNILMIPKADYRTLEASAKENLKTLYKEYMSFQAEKFDEEKYNFIYFGLNNPACLNHFTTKKYFVIMIQKFVSNCTLNRKKELDALHSKADEFLKDLLKREEDEPITNTQHTIINLYGLKVTEKNVTLIQELNQLHIGYLENNNHNKFLDTKYNFIRYVLDNVASCNNLEMEHLDQLSSMFKAHISDEIEKCRDKFSMYKKASVVGFVLGFCGLAALGIVHRYFFNVKDIFDSVHCNQPTWIMQCVAVNSLSFATLLGLYQGTSNVSAWNNKRKKLNFLLQQETNINNSLQQQ